MSNQNLRITAEELKRRMASGEDFTILDTRNPEAWAAATDKARGAIRADLNGGDAALPKIPSNQPAVAYCT